MERSSDWEQNKLKNELSQGRELAKQLQIHLNVPTSSREAREFLVHKILNSYDKALTMLKCNGSSETGEPKLTIGATIGRSDSPQSFSGSPKSDGSDDIKDRQARTESKKRKSSMPRWTKQVQVCPGTGLEGPLDDGYSWRKYGQKDILGAKYPRGYYKCTHRNTHGCLATKQVQRSDDDPMIFEVTYRGRHTCTINSQLTLPSPILSTSPTKLEPNTMTQLPLEDQNKYSQETLNFKTGLKVITDDLLENQNFNFPTSFNLPASTSLDNGKIYFSHGVEKNNFTNDNLFFASPATSAPTAGLGETHNNELMEIVSVATSVTSSPTVGLDFSFGPDMDPFGPSFSFDNPSLFF